MGKESTLEIKQYAWRFKKRQKQAAMDVAQYSFKKETKICCAFEKAEEHGCLAALFWF
jgi:hypothetical protein